MAHQTVLHGVRIGVFGAGHLGRALVARLAFVGVGDDDLAVCHRVSPATRRALREARLAHLVRPPAEVAERSSILLYAVRPQDYAAIAEHCVHPEAVFVSLLAGVPLDRIPVHVLEDQRVRVMPSTPDTLILGRAIAAVYPATNEKVRTLLELIGARTFPLLREGDVHAFTVLGPCLPAALAFWESLGKIVPEREVLDLAERFELPDPAGMLRWARDAQPRGLVGGELDSYLSQAATEGGVTEAVLQAIRDEKSLPDALRSGIQRSRQLAWET